MQNQIRIIGGKWRSRIITFRPITGLRPTTNMVRETIFNWLAPYIDNAICLDLFAGSGGLGFEAISREAKHVVMVDASFKVIKQLQENAKLLAANNVTCIHALMPRDCHKIPEQKFNIVFLDPPFNKNLVAKCCNALMTKDLLAKNCYIYIEVERGFDLAKILPSGWEIIRSKVAGHVCYNLIKVGEQ